MRKNKVQPAHKSYFLGQGYKDIGTAIKTSWLKNAQQKPITTSTVKKD